MFFCFNIQSDKYIPYFVVDEIIKKLQKRIKKLLIRNEQLHNLLKNVPNYIGKNKNFKITTDVSKQLQEHEMESK